MVHLFQCFAVYRAVLTVFLFGVRAFATSFFQAIYLYTPEVSSELETCWDHMIPSSGIPNYCESFWYVIVRQCQ